MSSQEDGEAARDLEQELGGNYTWFHLTLKSERKRTSREFLKSCPQTPKQHSKRFRFDMEKWFLDSSSTDLSLSYHEKKQSLCYSSHITRYWFYFPPVEMSSKNSQTHQERPQRGNLHRQQPGRHRARNFWGQKPFLCHAFGQNNSY